MTPNDPTKVRSMERVADGARLTWSPDARLFRLDSVFPDTVLAGNAGRELVSSFESWIAADDEPFGFLVDCSRIETADAAWRAVWSDFFDAQRERIRVAWYAATPQLQVIVRMVVSRMRVNGVFIGGVFLEEDQARAWLREQNIDA